MRGSAASLPPRQACYIWRRGFRVLRAQGEAGRRILLHKRRERGLELGVEPTRQPQTRAQRRREGCGATKLFREPRGEKGRSVSTIEQAILGARLNRQ